ncbi:MAG: acyl-CoA dehydrogenase [Acidobacteria bacterium]|nr:MAG: acyl-CoA dehydrogenase [Acidobacteriota bacterium]
MRLELTAEQAEFQQQIEAFARDVVAFRAAGIDRSGEFPADVIHAAAQHGLCGVTIPKQWGGAGRDYVSYALAIEAIARASATVAVALSVTNSLVAEVIAYAGRDHQRERWLRPLARGEAVGSFALSSGDHAGVIVVWARTGEPGAKGISCFLVEAGVSGLHVGKHEDKMGLRASTTVSLSFEDLRLPASALMGAEGQGFGIAMAALDGGRVGIAAQATGIGLAALDAAVRYAKDRQAFGQPIANYQAIQWMLADMATELAAARMLMLKAASAKETQDKSTVEASMAKLAASEAAHKAADKAMQILASAGYRRGSVVERLFRDVRATEIYQGTSEAQRMIIAANVLANG